MALSCANIIDVCTNGDKSYLLSVCLRVRGVMKHPVEHLIIPLCSEVKHPKGNFTIKVVIRPQKVFMKHLYFYGVPYVVHTNRDPK